MLAHAIRLVKMASAFTANMSRGNPASPDLRYFSSTPLSLVTLAPWHFDPARLLLFSAPWLASFADVDRDPLVYDFPKVSCF